jgi:hypothetical protein
MAKKPPGVIFEHDICHPWKACIFNALSMEIRAGKNKLPEQFVWYGSQAALSYNFVQ